MATGPLTQVADIVVPEHFAPYIQQLTEVKSRLVQSGVIARNAAIDAFLAGGALTFNVPSFRDLDDDADNVSTDDVADILQLSATAGSPALPSSFLDSIPAKVGTDTEIGVRLSRNKSWNSADLAAALAGADPLDSIMGNVSGYWMRRLQAIFVAVMNGVIKDNVANDSGDYQNDISGASYSAGVTDFSAEAFIDAKVTMGDSSSDLKAMMVHSIVRARMAKNNLIDFKTDSTGLIQIPTFMGHEVIEDDGMPNAGGVFDTWIFGDGAMQMGVGSAKVPVATHREELAGNGGGQEILTTRQEWALHPTGHAYTGTPADGGPGNGTGSNDLNIATSWDRVYGERKMIKFARLVTRES